MTPLARASHLPQADAETICDANGPSDAPERRIVPVSAPRSRRDCESTAAMPDWSVGRTLAKLADERWREAALKQLPSGGRARSSAAAPSAAPQCEPMGSVTGSADLTTVAAPRDAALIRSVAFSAIITTGAFVLPETMLGITEASITRRP